MNELKFNSQVCTTKIQSQRLLDLGLKPETADMKHFFDDRDDYPFFHHWKCFPHEWNEESLVDSENIPAWSLHRLLEMICNKECEEHYYFDFSMDYDSMVDVYDSIIEVIERHIKDNFINKEYLKQ